MNTKTVFLNYSNHRLIFFLSLIRDSSLQEEKKDNTVEIEHSLKSSPSRCKKNLETPSDREELLNTVRPQLDTAEKSESQCSEASNLSVR